MNIRNNTSKFRHVRHSKYIWLIIHADNIGIHLCIHVKLKLRTHNCRKERSMSQFGKLNRSILPDKSQCHVFTLASYINKRILISITRCRNILVKQIINA